MPAQLLDPVYQLVDSSGNILTVKDNADVYAAVLKLINLTISGGGNLTDGNGTTANGTAVDLGGILNQDTTILADNGTPRNFVITDAALQRFNQGGTLGSGTTSEIKLENGIIDVESNMFGGLSIAKTVHNASVGLGITSTVSLVGSSVVTSQKNYEYLLSLVLNTGALAELKIASGEMISTVTDVALRSSKWDLKGNVANLDVALGSSSLCRVEYRENSMKFKTADSISNTSDLELESSGSARVRVTNGTNMKQIEFIAATNGITVTDAINLLGFQYAADYSSAGLLNPRWIPDVATATNKANATGIDQITGPIITPPTLNSDQDDYNPTGFATCNMIRQEINGNRVITGFVAPPVGINRIIAINCISTSDNIKFKNNDSGSSANNRILLRDNGPDKSIKENETARFWYDHTSLRWRPLNRIG